MKGTEVISKEQLISMIHFLEERDEASKKLDEQLKEEKKSHQTSAIRHPTSDIRSLSPLAPCQKQNKLSNNLALKTLLYIMVMGIPLPF